MGLFGYKNLASFEPSITDQLENPAWLSSTFGSDDKLKRSLFTLVKGKQKPRRHVCNLEEHIARSTLSCMLCKQHTKNSKEYS